MVILAALAAFLADLCMTHLRFSGRVDSSLKASQIARSTISAGIARILDDQTFGQNGLAAETIDLPLDGGRGFLTFDPTTANAEGMSFSSNNLDKTTSIVGAGASTIPPNTVHLVARGVSGDVEKTVEVVLNVPPFPWAIASGGTLELKSGVVVGALPAGVWPPDPNQLLPADILANSQSTGSITLSAQSRVHGDVETPGSVILGGGPTTVQGEVREGVAPATIGRLKAADFDPLLTGATFDDLDAGVATASRLVLSGAARKTGVLDLPEGLELQGSQLFVDGDLHVRKGVRGSGVLVVTGDVTIESGLSLNAASSLAVFSGGSVRLKGVGPQQTAIRGIFYASQGLIAEEMTIVGSLIVPGSSARVELEQVHALSAPSMTPTITTTTTTTTGSTTVLGGYWGDFGGVGGETSPFGSYTSFLGAGGGGSTTQTAAGDPTTTTTSTPGTSTTTTTTTATGSKFLPLSDQIRVVSWFER